MIKQVKRNILRSSDWSPSAQSKKIKSCWTWLCSLKRSLVRLSEQVPVASGLARLKLAWGSLKRIVSRTTSHVRLELAYSSLKRTMSRINWARSLRARWWLA